ncbi:transglycosylase SLT domain-containing protein [Fictibacillus sp. 23RED33]|uniref:transglycosylase SLT domain-containing protein n=1 Tax=Fictibacillus sp. 23RED33 TaxID=2745879 RepID=UPI0018CD4191|nr:transglycosylase SLT domain-containing protein [Fictibacillus sp. 23RED33]MBH0173791.1 transglycosylase SLT domain-containing protein [Fictibacillus sp. 23RED33]
MKNVLKTTLLATVFSAVLWGGQSAEAATYSEAEKLVRQAEGYAGTVKWQVSYEYTKTIARPDMKNFNAAKEYRLKAQTAINTLPAASQRNVLNDRLKKNVDTYVNRAIAYIDAITAGEKIIRQQSNLNTHISSGNLEKLENTYHVLSEEIRKQAKLLYRVHGQSTRDAFLVKYKAPAESLIKGVKHEVTSSMLLDDIQALKLPEGISSSVVPVKVNEYQSYDTYINYPTLQTALNNKYNATMSKIVLPQNKMKDLITEVAIENGIPPEILKAIAYQESGDTLKFQQFKNNGEPIVSSDNGIGIMQITNHPTENVEDLKYNTRNNIEVGAELLKEKWSWTGDELPKINDGDPDVLENWYFAVLAYNGRSSINHPTNSGNYQNKIFEFIRSSSQVKVFNFNNLVYDISVNNGILDFTPKLQYETNIQNKTTQIYKAGQTLKITTSTKFRPEPNTIVKEKYTLAAGNEVQILEKGISDATGINHFVFYKVKVNSTGDIGYVFSGAFAK